MAKQKKKYRSEEAKKRRNKIRRDKIPKETKNKRKRSESYLLRKRTKHSLYLSYRRLNEEYQQKEKEIDKIRIKHIRENLPLDKKTENLINGYLVAIKDGPIHICHSCSGRFFSHSLRSMLKSNIEPTLLTEQLFGDTTEHKFGFCKTCYNCISKKKIPKLCTRDGLQMPNIPDELKDLNTIEERLISPVLPFMQIRELGYSGRQYGIKGNVVNVPIEIKETIDKLPRSLKETETIQIKLKRMVSHKSDYKFEYIRPNKVFKAAEYLSDKTLFRKHNIHLDINWLRNFNQERHDFVVNDDDKNTFDDSNLNIQREEVEVHDDFNEIDDNIPNPGECETMIMKNGLILAPGENKIPISFYSDDCEYLAFPNLYCGLCFNEGNPKKLSISDLAKYKLRYFDRRFAQKVTNIFYLCRHKQIDSIQQKINTVLKKKDLKNLKITAGDLLNKEIIDELIRKDDAYQILSQDRTSPVYWEKRMKDLMAMIRQLGEPTLFMTLSAAESQWPELISILIKIAHNKELTIEEFEQMSFQEKYQLIKNDPITCAQYFDRRFRELFKLLREGIGPFDRHRIIDFFVRTEFQHRGSPHVHCLLWLDNVPRITEQNDEMSSVEDFIDRLITCSTDFPECSEIIHLQTHKHSKSCRRQIYRTVKCRFGFPLFPMRKTRILKPMFAQKFKNDLTDEVKEKIRESYDVYVAIKAKMTEIDNMLKNNLPIPEFDSFLEDMDISEEMYINAIRSQIKMTTVFLKREVKDIRVNAYNPLIFSLFRSNMDLQYIVDPYGCVHYIVNYISKSYRGVSRLMREAIEESNKGNNDQRRRLNVVSHAFLNSSEISAQEAVYVLLSMPLTMCSRQCIFVNTGERDKRTKMIKSKAQLLKLDPESTDIMSKGIIDYYMWRPKKLDDICLADFASKYHLKNEINEDINEVIVEDPEISINTEIDKTKRIKIIDPKTDKTLCTLFERKVPKIIRYRRYQLSKESNQYFREKLMLYKPWRDEDNDILNKDIEKIFFDFQNLITENEKRFVKNQTIDYDSIRKDLELRRVEEEDSSELNNELNEYSIYDSLRPQYSLNTDIPIKLSVKDKVSTFRTPHMSSNEDYYSLIRSLNEGQRIYLLGLINLVRNGAIPVYHFITGGAGTGKSVLIRAIYQTLIREFSKDVDCANVETITVLLSAPTGMAAFNINGSTIHSALGLTTNENTSKEMKPLGDELKNSYRQKLYHLKVLIIDEVSMVGNRMLSKINERLQQIFDSSLIFGGISILFFGDFNQLRPVKESPVFYPKNVNNLESLAGNCLWSPVRIYRLNEIMRQKDDLAFANALNNLANFSLTEEDMILFKDRIFGDESDRLDRRLNKLPLNCIHLFSTNKEVDNHNKFIIESSDEKQFEIKAKDSLPVGLSNQEREVANKYITDLNDNQTQGLPFLVKLKKNIRYMITVNIDVNDGLVNGTIGILKIIDVLEEQEIPITLWFDFEREDIGLKTREKFNVKSNLTPIRIIEKQIMVKIFSKYVSVTREQFPLKPAQAITIHKSQGQSYNEVVVHLTKGLHINHYYTALSRAKSSDGLYLIGEFAPPNKPSFGNERITEEIQRMESDSLLQFDINFPINDNKKLVFYQNFPYLSVHSPDIICDHKIRTSDILIFVETYSNSVFIDGFKLLHQIDYQQNSPKSRPFGIGVYGKPHIETSFVSKDVFISNKTDGHIEMLAFDSNNTRFIVIYLSPKLKKRVGINKLDSFVDKYLSDQLILIGDFNIDINTKDGQKLKSTLNKYNLNFRLKYNSVSTVAGTQIDLLFSNFDLDAFYYESIISYHKPVFAFI